MKSIVLCISLFAMLLGCSREKTSGAKIENFNVLLIVVDTLGASHVGTFGGANLTPNIDQLVTQGVRFQRAYSTAPWTKPSLASLFTSQLPSAHGVIGLNSDMSFDLKTMSEFLKSLGYKTMGMVSHTLIAPKRRFSQGFDSYEIVKFPGNVHDSITSNQVSERAISWLENEKNKSGNFFMFLHYFDPHFNYQHHTEFDQTSSYKSKITPGLGFRELRDLVPSLTAEDLKYLKGLYHEEVAYTDHHIGRLMQYLKESQIAERTLIIFVADHGEEFLDHGGIGHTRTLYDELIRIPLSFTLPKLISPREIHEPVSVMDVLPTIMELLGQPSDPAWEGIALTNELLGRGTRGKRSYFFSEVDFKSSAINAHKIALIDPTYKLIFDKPTQDFELYDLNADRLEKNDLFKSRPDVAGPLSKELLEYRDATRIRLKGRTSTTQPENGSEAPNPKELEELQSLGYL